MSLLVFVVYAAVYRVVCTEGETLDGCKNCTQYGLETLKECSLAFDTQCGDCLEGYFNQLHKGVIGYPDYCSQCELRTSDEACINTTMTVQRDEHFSESSYTFTLLYSSIALVLVVVIVVVIAVVLNRHSILSRNDSMKHEETPREGGGISEKQHLKEPPKDQEIEKLFV